jgi:hypothetical protein
MIKISFQTWLSQLNSNGELFCDDAYELEMHRVFNSAKTNLSRRTLNAISDLARATSLHHYHPTRRQVARFWYHAGITYSENCRWLLSHEAFEMCQRRIEPQDKNALLLLHSKWFIVAVELQHWLLAYQSCELMLSMLDRANEPHYHTIEQTRDRIRAILSRRRVINQF